MRARAFISCGRSRVERAQVGRLCTNESSPSPLMSSISLCRAAIFSSMPDMTSTFSRIASSYSCGRQCGCLSRRGRLQQFGFPDHPTWGGLCERSCATPMDSAPYRGPPRLWWPSAARCYSLGGKAHCEVSLFPSASMKKRDKYQGCTCRKLMRAGVTADQGSCSPGVHPPARRLSRLRGPWPPHSAVSSYVNAVDADYDVCFVARSRVRQEGRTRERVVFLLMQRVAWLAAPKSHYLLRYSVAGRK